MKFTETAYSFHIPTAYLYPSELKECHPNENYLLSKSLPFPSSQDLDDLQSSIGSDESFETNQETLASPNTLPSLSSSVSSILDLEEEDILTLPPPSTKIPRVLIYRDKWLHEIGTIPIPLALKSPRIFSVMSWNILLPAWNHQNNWSSRKTKILEQILCNQPDIFCLQEILPQDYYHFFSPYFSKLGYQAVYERKHGQEIQDGCATFFRHSRFELVDHEVVRYNQVPIEKDRKSSSYRDIALRFNLFHNLALITVLKNRATATHIRIVNTHLLANPEFPDAKLLQAAILTEKLQKSRLPTVLAGDLNSLPKSPVVRFLLAGRVDRSAFLGHDFGRFTNRPLRHYLRLRSAYHKSLMSFNNKSNQFEGVIDHVLYTTPTLRMIGILDALQTNLHPCLSLPNDDCPSDHLPILSYFEEKLNLSLNDPENYSSL